MKILDYIDELVDAYKEPVQRLTGLLRNPKDIIRTVEFYTSSQYLSGNTDENGIEKPFYEVNNYRVTIAKVGTDIDVKDCKFEPESLTYSIQAMLINKELFQTLKDIKFSETLNDTGLTRPKYGGVILKKTEQDGKLKIEVVDWVNIDFDPSDVLGGALIESFYLQPSELASKADVWNEYDSVEDVLKAHAKANKNKPAKIEIKEITGEFNETFDPKITEKDADEYKFKRMCFYVACVGKKKFLMYKEDQKESNFKYLAWEKVGKGLGRGIVEAGFDSQWAINDTILSLKKAMDLTTKVVGKTTSKKAVGNAITGVKTGHIFELEPTATLDFSTLGNINLAQFQTAIDLWNQQYDKSSSTYNANTGEAPTAGTPYSQTALLNQVANSPFEYQREVWGIFLNEVLNDWVLPYVKKQIIKNHNLVADYTDEELDLIDEAVANKETNRAIVDAVINGETPTNTDAMMMRENVKGEMRKKLGNKREISIPAKWLDVDGKITANITGELKNKQAILQSLDSVFTRLISTYNLQTGKFAALEDPILSKVFGQIVEMAGVPISFGLMKGKSSPATSVMPMQPAQDLSAIQLVK